MRTRGPARYIQIADHLRLLIDNADPGDRLPSEADLSEQFEVSRMTARQAMQLVASEGLIERRRGAGTFVRSAPIPRDLGSPLSFSDTMAIRGKVVTSRTLGWGEVTPSEDESVALGVGGPGSAHALERLRLADAIPMALERVVMPTELALRLDEGFEKGSLHDAFRRLGRRPSEAHAEVSARKATKRQRDLLELPPGGIIIAELRTIYDQNDAPLERTETCYAANRYSFRAILRQTEQLT